MTGATILGTVLVFLGWPIAGALGVIGVFNKQRNERRLEDDKTAANLINNLRITTELQEKEIQSLRKKENEQSKELANMQGQIKILGDILQGSDPSMQAFLREFPVMVETMKQSNDMARMNAQAITNLATTLNDYFVKIQK